jgi:anti-sigma factor RsiW
MTAPHSQHLTWDDLDDLLMGTERSPVHVHLETCAECRALAAADLDAVVQLQRLPQLSPRPGFADRVMVAVAGDRVADRPTVPHASLGAGRPSDRSPWLKAAAVIFTLGSLGTSLGWSLANQSLLLTLRGDAITTMQRVAGQVLQALAGLPQATLVAALRDTVGGVGVGLIVTAIAAGYLAGLLSLRRLVAVPGQAP